MAAHPPQARQASPAIQRRQAAALHMRDACGHVALMANDYRSMLRPYNT